MKLVELLANELSEWPKKTVQYVQGRDGCWPLAFDGARFEGNTWILKSGQTTGSKGDVLHIAMASDYKTAQVTRAQWQAERDRQKGGEWKRHRGGKCPVDGKAIVEYRLRNGYTDTWTASSLDWSHTKVEGDVMQFRVIGQPQAEEVEMIKVDPVVAANVEAFNGQWQIGRVDGPLVWRDTVNELDAYIEEFTREREALINRLALEGFALIPAMTAVMGVANVDMVDWRNWKAGDIVECLTDSYSGVYTKGQQYKVKSVNRDDFDVFDNYGESSSCVWDDSDCDGLKFVSRP